MGAMLRQRCALVCLALLQLLTPLVHAGWHLPVPGYSSDGRRGSQSHERASRLLQEASSVLEWQSGVLVVRALSLGDGGDDVAFLLRRANDAPILELVVPNEGLMGSIAPGTHVTVHGQMAPTGEFVVVEMFPTALTPVSSTFASSNAASVAELAAASATSTATATASRKRSPSMPSDPGVSGGAVASLAVAATTAPWTQKSMVTDMPVLVMIASMCGEPPAASVEDVQGVLFNGPNSQSRTLQGYLWECSRGKSTMNSSNSKVVGPIPIPCSYNSSKYNFTADNCAYTDSDGWHTWAQQYAKTVLGINVDAYTHRVLVLPRYYSMSMANCPWVGQGTLGPDMVSDTGQYLSSKVWLSGEYWNQVAAYMHELGHTNYLHHALQGSCPYCDASCLMGSCCEVRCFNTPHNWQLGWSSPLAILRSATLQPATWTNFFLPAQQLSDRSIIMIQPDWTPGYQFGRQYMWFIGYRIDSGNYDTGIPGDYTFQTNIYWWDGMYQVMPVMTRWYDAIYNGEEFRNNTDMFVIKQLSGGTEGAMVSICRATQFVERSCNDGIDNDCDGKVDDEDPDCMPPAVPVAMTSPPPPQPPEVGSEYYDYVSPPPPHPIRPPHPPSPPPPPSPAGSPPPSPLPPPPSPPPPSPPSSPSPPPPSPPSPPSPGPPRNPILTLSPPPPPPSELSAELPAASPVESPQASPKASAQSPKPLPKWKLKPPPVPPPPSPPPVSPSPPPPSAPQQAQVPVPKGKKPPPPLPKWKMKPPPVPPPPSPPPAASVNRGLRHSAEVRASDAGFTAYDSEQDSRYRVDWASGAAAAGSVLGLQGTNLPAAAVNDGADGTEEELYKLRWKVDWSSDSPNQQMQSEDTKQEAVREDGGTREPGEQVEPGSRSEQFRQRLALLHGQKRQRQQHAARPTRPLINWWEDEESEHEGGFKTGL